MSSLRLVCHPIHSNSQETQPTGRHRARGLVRVQVQVQIGHKMQFSSAVSVDPLILAEANRIVDTTRQEALQFAGNVVGQVRGEAESLLEQERANVQAEASQFVNQIHHQAQRVVDETQSKAATEVQSIVKSL